VLFEKNPVSSEECFKETENNYAIIDSIKTKEVAP
jgi:hypothetical protein